MLILKGKSRLLYACYTCKETHSNALIISIFTGTQQHTVSRHWIFDMLSLYKRLEPDKYQYQYPRFITTEIFTWYYHDATINVCMIVNTLCSSYNFDIWYVASSGDPLTPRFKFWKLCGYVLGYYLSGSHTLNSKVTMQYLKLHLNTCGQCSESIWNLVPVALFIWTIA